MRARAALVVVGVVFGLTACASRPAQGHAPGPVAVAPPPAPPPSAPAPPTPRAVRVRSLAGITEYGLPNGLTVLLVPDPTQATVTVNITYLVGSRHEGAGETGMAHLLEHMLFKGTPRHPDVFALLEARGAEVNGTTGTDRTNYHETLPATPENLAFALALEADRMVNATIASADLATELTVVRNELEMGENDARAILEQRMVAAAFLWHGYGRDTIGARSDIERVPVAALRTFYARHYQPDNAILVVAGRFDEPATLAAIDRTLGTIPRPARVLTPTYTVEPVQDGERGVVLQRAGDLHVVGVAYHTVSGASPDYPAVLAALDLLDRDPGGRLYQRLVVPGLAASVDATAESYRDPFLAIAMAEVPEARHVDAVERILREELERLATAPIDPRALARWRASTLKELTLAMTRSQDLALALSEYAALGDWRTLLSFRAHVEAVTEADVRRIARAYFVPSNRTVGRFVPTAAPVRAPATEAPALAPIVAAGAAHDAALAGGEPFPATLEAIETRTLRASVAGVALAVLPKATRGSTVQLRLDLHWGDAASLAGTQATAQLMARLLGRGTRTRALQALRDAEDALMAEIEIVGDAQGVRVELRTLRPHLAAALDLVVEMLRSPSFPAAELARVKQERAAEFAQLLQDPEALAWVTLAQRLTRWPASDPRYAQAPREQLAAQERVTRAQLVAFHGRFVGAGHAQLAVVGDVDPVALQARVRELFGGWTTPAPYARLAGRAFGLPGQEVTLPLPDKEMARIVIGHDVALRDTDPDYPAWVLLGHVLGGDGSSRVWQRLRQREGLSYGAEGWTEAGVLDDEGGVGVAAIVAPANLPRARAALLEELTQLTTTAVPADELARAKRSWRTAQDTRLADDGAVTSLLVRQLYEGRTTAELQTLRARVAEVTPADVLRVARTYVQLGRLVIVTAGSDAP